MKFLNSTTKNDADNEFNSAQQQRRYTLPAQNYIQSRGSNDPNHESTSTSTDSTTTGSMVTIYVMLTSSHRQQLIQNQLQQLCVQQQFAQQQLHAPYILRISMHL